MGHSSRVDPKGFCDSCQIGKLTRQPLGLTDPRSKENLVHCDLFGPVETTSVGGNRFAIIFVDDATRYKEIYFLERKNEALAAFRKYCASHIVKCLHSDNDTVLKSAEFQRFCEEKGIRQTFSAPYTPQQNGVAERSWRTLTESALAMLSYANLDKKYWAFAMDTANYISNRTYHKTIKGTPFEARYGKRPNEKRLRVFGCPAFYLVEQKKKFDHKAEEGIFVGYTAAAYKIWTGKKVVVSRNVTFNEKWKDVELPVEDNDELPENYVEIESEPENENESSDHEEELDSDNVDESNNVSLRRSTRERRPPQPFWETSAMVASVEEAMQDDAWRTAMIDELKSLNDNKTFLFCKRPKDRELIEGKWVLKVKHKEDGSIDKYKARYVAKGYSQIPEIDYMETYSPVTRIETIRALVNVAAKKNLVVQQMDVKTAYLNSELQEDIYMQIPEAYELYGKVPDGAECVKLNKALYGLKQGARQWFKCLSSAVSEIGMEKTDADEAVFVKEVDGKRIVMAAYVDDLIIVSESDALTKELKGKLCQRFDMKDLGIAKFILGIQIEHTTEGIEIHQSNYIENILKKFNMQDCKSVEVPSTGHLDPAEDDEEEVDVPYSSAIGALLYLANTTRPDICHAVREAAQYVKDYRKKHWEGVKRIIRYLKGTIDLRIIYRRQGGLILEGFADADYANCKKTRRSITGNMFFLGGDIIVWTSRKQRVVSLSTAEAELYSLAESMVEATWLRRLLADIGAKQEQTTEIFGDNQAALRILTDANYTRVKHIEVRKRFISEKMEVGDLKLVYCETENMIADICTKPLAKDRFRKLTKRFLEREC